MKETITITVGRSPLNEWRRSNLMKLPYLKDMGSYYECSFNYVDGAKYATKEVTLIYHILK